MVDSSFTKITRLHVILLRRKGSMTETLLGKRYDQDLKKHFVPIHYKINTCQCFCRGVAVNNLASSSFDANENSFQTPFHPCTSSHPANPAMHENCKRYRWLRQTHHILSFCSSSYRFAQHESNPLLNRKYKQPMKRTRDRPAVAQSRARKKP